MMGVVFASTDWVGSSRLLQGKLSSLAFATSSYAQVKQQELGIQSKPDNSQEKKSIQITPSKPSGGIRLKATGSETNFLEISKCRKIFTPLSTDWMQSPWFMHLWQAVSDCCRVCLGAVCPLGWLWAQEMDLVSAGCPPLLGCPWLQATGTVPRCLLPQSSSCTASREPQCFPGLSKAVSQSHDSGGFPVLTPCPASGPVCGWAAWARRAARAPRGHWGRQSDPTALSQRLITLCHKWAQVQSVFDSEQSLLSLPYSYSFKPHTVMLSLQSRGTAWHLLFPFYLKQ